jgi:hypothetical protein
MLFPARLSGYFSVLVAKIALATERSSTLAINLTGFAVVLVVCDFFKPVRFSSEKVELLILVDRR